VPDPHSWLLFGLAALALLLVPGPAVLYVVAQSAEHGRRAGLVSVAGLHAGTLVHTAAAAVGLSALVVSSAVAFSVVKYAGVAYLIYLGVRRLLTKVRPPEVEHRDEPLRRLFRQGVVVNVLNPKTALFFLAFLPQFVDALAAGTLGGVLRRRRNVLRYTSGGVYVGLGAATAFAKRG
jgi:threonine/homoserine/homoserine lactone efflux protein